MNIGKNVSVTAGCFITSSTGAVNVGDHSMIGLNIEIVGNRYKYDNLDIPVCMQETTSKGISIGKNVWIGAGASIMNGAIIGHGVIVAPNSVVSSRIPDNSIVQGNPAKVIFNRR